MFTGIVQGAFAIKELQRKPGLHSFMVVLSDELMAGLEVGASVAMEGVCLTVTQINGNEVWFDAMQQTLSLTTLGELQQGSLVNIERSARQGVEIGGHIISGHVDACVEVLAVSEPENNRFVTYSLPAEQAKYVFNKGFIGLNGCSLTVAEVDKIHQTFTVCYIPETLRVTTHGMKVVGDKLNIEIDRQTQAIVDTVENFLRANPGMLTST